MAEMAVNGKMDRFQFVVLLEEGLLGSAHAMGLGDDFILLQDNGSYCPDYAANLSSHSGDTQEVCH